MTTKINKTALKQKVADNIYPNGKHQITANNVSTTLNEVVDKTVDTINDLVDNSATKTELANIGAKVGGVDASNSNSLFAVVDADGNVVSKIDASGLSTIALKIKQNGNLKDILTIIDDACKNASTSGIINEYSDSLYITDAEGNVFFSIAKNASGVYELNYVGKSQGGGSTTNFFTNKNVYSLGDSLSTKGLWQSKFAEIAGANFNKTLNYSLTNGKSFSCGGTKSLSVNNNCGQLRAKFMRDYIVSTGATKGENCVIFWQNINDAERTQGSSSDLAYYCRNMVEGGTYTSQEELESALSTEISAITPTVGTMLKMTYITTSLKAYKVSVTGTATSNGTVTISLGGVKFSNDITTGMTAQDVAVKIEEWDYSVLYFEDVRDGNDVYFYEVTSTQPLSVIQNVSGINVTVTQLSEGHKIIGYCFTSYDVSEWNDTTKWKKESSISRWSAVKGLCEYVMTELPKSWFCIVNTPRLTTGLITYRSDGSINYDAVQSHYATYYKFMQDVANYYHIPVVDLQNETAINFLNMKTGDNYPENNVHPYDSTYEKWGTHLARVLI